MPGKTRQSINLTHPDLASEAVGWDPSIVTALEKSEKTNKVYKQNAGAAQENVKHPKDLMNRVNHLVIPDYADLLITLHENSELSV